MANDLVTERLALPLELHAATRSEHLALNRTIIARLPLCLPNATTTTDLYTQGMTVIGQLYYGIEEAWDILLSKHTLERKHKAILTQLDIPHLRRTKRLEASLVQLRTKSKYVSSAQLSQLDDASSHFRDEVRQSILERPHLLMAYTWTMYLALFNGGRFMAKQLLSAGSFFWNEDRTATVSGALSFWFFGDNEDYNGENIKLAFKDKFDLVARSLTDKERDEIIAESKKVFQMCADMVAFLDQHVQSTKTEQLTTIPSDAAIRKQDTADTPSYRSYITPTSITTFWRSVSSRMPFSQNSIPASLRHEIEQK